VFAKLVFDGLVSPSFAAASTLKSTAAIWLHASPNLKKEQNK